MTFRSNLVALAALCTVTFSTHAQPAKSVSELTWEELKASREKDYEDQKSADEGTLPALRRCMAMKARTQRLDCLEELPQRYRPREVRLGMSQEDIVRGTRWGRPLDAHRSISSGRTREQWVYPGGVYLYFENGRLTSIQD